MNGPKQTATSGRCSVRGCDGPVPPPEAPRRGFTIVELLVVITIIGLLAGLAMGALASARVSARTRKTKATIAKLDMLVQGHYDSYRTRRVTIYTNVSGSAVRVNPATLGSPHLAAWIRLRAIRDLMRMEMPERWADFVEDPTANPGVLDSTIPFATPGGPVFIKPPPLAGRYYRKFRDQRPSGDYDSAECLYLWINSAVADARDQFMDNEIGDADADGWPEFHDGWGNPIKFLRWAPAFADSDIQPVIMDRTIVPPQPDITNLADRRSWSEADHDPFDPRKLDVDLDPSDSRYSNWPPRGGWRLVPLIYSAGPDGIYGISHEGAYEFTGNPYVFPNPSPWAAQPRTNYDVVRVGGPVPAGSLNAIPIGPKETNSDQDYLDNIHNHRVEDN